MVNISRNVTLKPSSTLLHIPYRIDISASKVFPLFHNALRVRVHRFVRIFLHREKQHVLCRLVVESRQPPNWNVTIYFQRVDVTTN